MVFKNAWMRTLTLTGFWLVSLFLIIPVVTTAAPAGYAPAAQQSTPTPPPDAVTATTVTTTEEPASTLVETRKAPAFPDPGSYTAREDFGGFHRSYRIYIPVSYPEMEQPVPLVVVMHGAGGDGGGIEGFSDFNTLADRDGFILVYPDGIAGAWNDGRPSESLKDINDVGFIEHIVDYMLSALNIDPTRVYMTGYSMGGMMAYRLGCLLPEKVAAIASVASTFPRYQDTDCENAPAVPVLLIQGTYDEIIPWSGSVPYYSAGATIEWWVKHNQCVELSDITEEFDVNPDDPIRVRRETFNQCADNTEVTIYGALGGGHTWPGHRIKAPFELGDTAMDIDATSVIWEFFQRHSGHALGN